jgi:4a-hydroxytetrahydrobiopterin dehydratase
MDKYNEQTIREVLKELKNWRFENNGINQEFVFKNFSEAMGFIDKVGILAEKMNHHPEWCNVYNNVTIRLTTHDANGVTSKDIDLAKAIDTLLV